MPKFKVIFHRTVEVTEEVVREVEAESLEAASALADDMSDEFDSSCPDDATEVGGAECNGWFVELCFEPSANPELAAEYPPDDADLALAAEGEICTACERDSIDCSRDPCPAVIEDRGE